MKFVSASKNRGGPWRSFSVPRGIQRHKNKPDKQTAHGWTGYTFLDLRWIIARPFVLWWYKRFCIYHSRRLGKNWVLKSILKVTSVRKQWRLNSRAEVRVRSQYGMSETFEYEWFRMRVKYFTTRHESPATCGKNQVLFWSVTSPATSGYDMNFCRW